MKHTLLVLGAALFMFACNNGKEGTNTTTTSTTTTDTIAKPVVPGSQNPSVDNIAIPIDTGSAWIRSYHQKVGFRDSAQNGLKVSFMLDANALRKYLNDSQNVTKLDIYLAQNPTSTTLVYIGAVDSTDAKTKEVFYVERPYYKTTDAQRTKPMALDMTSPCPQCLDRMRAINAPDIDKKKAK